METITSINENKYVDKTLNIVLDGEMDGWMDGWINGL